MRGLGIGALALGLLLLLLTVARADGEVGALRRVLLPEAAGVAARNGAGPSDAEGDTGSQRARRSPDAEDYENDGEEGPEGRHLHKLKRKFRPHKFGLYGGSFGNHYPAFGGYNPGLGCRKLHGCGGHGWQRPQYGGAFAGPSPGYNPGGWNNPGWRPRPGAQSQFATWNLGPFQASLGLAQAG